MCGDNKRLSEVITKNCLPLVISHKKSFAGVMQETEHNQFIFFLFNFFFFLFSSLLTGPQYTLE